jgi:hypothetical protein
MSVPGFLLKSKDPSVAPRQEATNPTELPASIDIAKAMGCAARFAPTRLPKDK